MGSCGPWTLTGLIQARLGGNGDDDLSVSAFAPDCSTVGGRSLVQRKGSFDECSEMSSVELPGDFDELLLIGLDDEVSIFYSLVGCAFAVRGNGDHASTWLEDTP